jgi:hypothetical protein
LHCRWCGVHVRCAHPSLQKDEATPPPGKLVLTSPTGIQVRCAYPPLQEDEATPPGKLVMTSPNCVSWSRVMPVTMISLFFVLVPIYHVSL